MGAESTQNAVSNKDDCLKLHHVGYLINRINEYSNCIGPRGAACNIGLLTVPVMIE